MKYFCLKTNFCRFDNKNSDILYSERRRNNNIRGFEGVKRVNISKTKFELFSITSIGRGCGFEGKLTFYNRILSIHPTRPTRLNG